MLQLAQMPRAYTLLAGLGWARTSKALDLYGPDLMPNRINVSKSASLTWASRRLPAERILRAAPQQGQPCPDWQV